MASANSIYVLPHLYSTSSLVTYTTCFQAQTVISVTGISVGTLLDILLRFMTAWMCAGAGSWLLLHNPQNSQDLLILESCKTMHCRAAVVHVEKLN